MELARVAERHQRAFDLDRRLGMRDVDHVQAVGCGHEQVAELEMRRARALDRDRGGDPRLERIVEVEHHDAGIRGHVHPAARDEQVARAVQHAALVPGQRALEEVVARLAVAQGLDVGEDQAFRAVGDQRVLVDRVHRLFLPVLQDHVALVARVADGLGRGQRDAGGVRALDVRALAERRDRRGDDLLGEALVADARDVVRARALGSFGHVDVLATELDAARGARGVLHGDLQRLPVVLVLLEVIGVGVVVQEAADHGLRLVPLGDADGRDLAVAADPGVVADEVDELRPQAQELRHDRVVVVRLRQVAIRAGLGLGAPFRVRVVRRHRLRAVAGCRDRRLLGVDPLAVDVLRAQHQRRGGAHRRDLVVLDRAVDAEHVDVVARDLRVVGRVVAREAALVAVALGAPVRLDRKVAAAAARGPRAMAGVAQHLVLAVRALVLRHVGAEAERARVHRHGVGAIGLGVVRRPHEVVQHHHHKQIQAQVRREPRE